MSPLGAEPLGHPGPATRARLEETLLALLRIPSVTGQEQAVAAWVRERLAQVGVPVAEDAAATAVVAPAPPDPRPCLGLFGHLDTVPLAGSRPVACDAERIWGRGASDMKAGLACMLLLAERLPAGAGPQRRAFVFYDREEGPYADNGLEALLDHSALRDLGVALVLEPTDGGLQLGALGTLHARLRVHGQAAHSARPWLGRNAITLALPHLQTVADLPQRAVEREGLVFREAASLTLLSAGQTRNVIPDLLEANVNLRFAPGRSPQEVFAELRALLPAAVELELVDACPAAAPRRDQPLFVALEALSGRPAQAKQAWTDVARLALRGVPAANFGPGDPALAHKDEEHVRRDRLWETYGALERLLLGG